MAGIANVRPSRSTRITVSGDTSTEDVTVRIMGLMLPFAWNRVRHYHSDVIRDGYWLERHVVPDVLRNVSCKRVEFYWSVRDTGTSIGMDEVEVRRLGGELFVVVGVRLSDDEWAFGVTGDE